MTDQHIVIERHRGEIIEFKQVPAKIKVQFEDMMMKTFQITEPGYYSFRAIFEKNIVGDLGKIGLWQIIAEKH